MEEVPYSTYLLSIMDLLLSIKEYENRVNQESNSCYIEIIYDNFSLIVMRKYIHAFGDVVCNPKGTKGCAFIKK